MKIIVLILIFSFSSNVLSECRRTDHDGGGEERKVEGTALGGCTYFSPILRVGYSNEYSGYLGIGGLVPLDQSSDWEGGFSGKGIAIIATKYEDGEIYDLGYSQRRGWAIFSTGWDIGFSYRNSSDQDMKGVYLGYTFIGSAVIRYLESKSDSQISIEFGLKY
jgi:hypothetical protein